MKFLIAITIPIFIAAVHATSQTSSVSAIDPSSDLSDDAYLDLVSGSLCDNNATVALELMRKTDECIINDHMKAAIGACRSISYGSDDQFEAKDMYCSKGEMMRNEMDDLFNICLQEQGLDVESIQAEWVANCGFCENPQLVMKMEQCFVEGEIKHKWHSCRFEVFGTVDPILSAKKYCSGDRDTRLANDEAFDDCLYNAGVTRESFDAAMQDC